MHALLRTATPLLAAALLAGCAALSNLSTEVSSYGEWPADRAPGTYAFERLPSQQALAEQTAALEAAARPALEKAGFKAAAEGQQPDVLVQVGLRTSRTESPLWADPLWWRGGFGYWHRGPWVGPYWNLHLRAEPPRYEREVAVLLRDRASGKPLFEARASHEGTGGGGNAVVQALYEAALMDFPRLGPNPRRVVVALPSAR